MPFGGSIPDIPADSNLFSTEQTYGPGVYDEFNSEVSYENDSGLLVLPVAGPAGTPPVVIRTHAPVTRKVVRFSAVRTGLPPRAPGTKELSDGDALIGWTVMPASPVLMSNGASHGWAICGTYVYAMRKPVGPGSSLPAGGSPIDQTPAASNDFPASSFDPNLAP